MSDQVVVILQARTGSSRLRKGSAELAGRPMLEFLLEGDVRLVDRCILATTELAEDDCLTGWVIRLA